MSTFKKHLSITERPGTSIDIVTTGERVGIIVTDGGNAKMVKLDPTDAPAIALAVLEAAGHKPLFRHNSNHGTTEALEWIAYLLDKSIAATEAKAAAAAEEAARGKRRDELAREVAASVSIQNSALWGYSRLSGISKRLIDRIIDAENELAKERAK